MYNVVKHTSCFSPKFDIIINRIVFDYEYKIFYELLLKVSTRKKEIKKRSKSISTGQYYT